MAQNFVQIVISKAERGKHPFQLNSKMQSSNTRQIKKCSVCGVAEKNIVKGLCQKHYSRLKRYGNPTFSPVQKICSVENCNAKHRSSGFCHRHYCQIWKHGSLLPSRQQQFWAQVKVTDKNKCWLWQGKLDRYGYGLFTLTTTEGKVISQAHRASYFFRYHHPQSLFVCHSCDNPTCVNPHHLFLGTTASNMTDMVLKGRSARGDRHSQAKLKTEQVLSIRADAAKGVLFSYLAEKYSVCEQTISDIFRRKTWKHLGRNEQFCPECNY